ncbi:hypothetical protein FRC09_002641 [Ceratobasidium sp. 395]|nr:hypothetical protein FRC09_002641 [Ceratobasidium sp. 395]
MLSSLLALLTISPRNVQPPPLSPFRPLPDAFAINVDHFNGEDMTVTVAKPLVELEMTRLSAALREKDLWWTKFQNEEILAKWRVEAVQQAKLMKPSHIDYVLKELDGYAKLRDEATGVEVGCYDKIWQSDKLVPSSLKQRLLDGIAKLENVPDSEKDWHPRSNHQVLDLVHPSLYPIVYERTLAYHGNTSDPQQRRLQAIPMPPVVEAHDKYGFFAEDGNYHVSYQFQWLPTDFEVSQDGKSAKSVSYINNLNPGVHLDLHHTLEDVVAKFVPLFEHVLTDSIPENKAVPQRVPNEYSYNETYAPQPEWSDNLDEEENEAAWQQWAKNRPYFGPEVNPRGYQLGSLEHRRFNYTLAGKTIQVIVKLANIHLTPEKPTYAGGSWHIEGMSNEAIAVSGLYYYDEDNISESRLAFRTAAANPGTYEQGDKRGCLLTWGVGPDEPCVNELGSIRTSQDRTIAFPNVYQHRVSPFELKDKTRPGHRKIVALFLVDPAIHRPSTTTVPPQQQDWHITPNPDLGPNFLTRVEGGMSRREAENYRLELMDERTAFVKENNDKFFSVAFSMCEH